jgi:hypothetical protein
MRNRQIGFISYWAASESGGWGFIRADARYFFHGSRILSGVPELGAVVIFTPLPRLGPGPANATEIEIVRPALKRQANG